MRRVVTLAAAVTLCVAGNARAVGQQQGDVNLLNGADGTFMAPGEIDGSAGAGASVVGLGRVLGRARDAFAVGAPEADPANRLGAGSVYVVAGRASGKPVDLSSLHAEHRIDGAMPGDELGYALAAVRLRGGDRGLAIGAPYASPDGRGQAGAVYVIDLKRLTGNIDLSAHRLPKAVVGVVRGARACAQTGYALADAGPLKPGAGDALAVGAPGLDPSGCAISAATGVSGGNAGGAYLLDLHRLSRRLDLSRMTRGLARFSGAAPGDRAGSALSRAGTRGAVLIGAPGASPKQRAAAGDVVLVRGARTGRSVSLASPPAGSTTILGAAADDALGSSLTITKRFATAQPRGAVDLVLGAPQASPRGRAEAGSAFVLPATLVRGAQIDLATPPAGIGRIDGAGAGDEAGFVLAGVPDLNGNGRADLAIGAPFVNSETGTDRIDNGAAYVAYGGTGTLSLDLAHLHRRGYAVFGARNSDEAGTAVGGIGDENGDGRPDLLVGAPFAADTLAPEPSAGGAVYVVRGFTRR